MLKGGKITRRTEIWAEGYDKWYPLESVSQFKWKVCPVMDDFENASTPKAPHLYSLSELCVVILDTLIQMCSFFPSRDEANAVIRPLPKIKKILSEPVCLYQIVPLILTDDPDIVQRVAALLLAVMEVCYLICNQVINRFYFRIINLWAACISPVFTTSSSCFLAPISSRLLDSFIIPISNKLFNLLCEQ